MVTGHTGFIGSWLSIWLHGLGAKVTGYSLAPPTSPSNFELSGVKALLEAHIEHDVRDAEHIRRAVEDSRPELLFHLAAQPLVRKSYAEPRETFETNVIGTCSVLDAVRAFRRPCAVVVTTSDKCYENRDVNEGYRESDPLGGHDPYSASKGACEIVVSSYRRSFFPPEREASHGVRLASVRAGNAIGGGDWGEHRLVPDVVRAVGSGRSAEIRNPTSVRPWQHVLELVSGLLKLASKLKEPGGARFASAWNFGPQATDAVEVRALVEMLLQKLGRGSWIDASDRSSPHEGKLLRLAIDRAVSELGWRPRWSLSQAVARTARWYGRWLDGSTSMLEECRADIEAHEGPEC
jgi:CDP-glucose 4,6-dehydratase